MSHAAHPSSWESQPGSDGSMPLPPEQPKSLSGWFVPLAGFILVPMQLARSYKPSAQLMRTRNDMGVRLIVLWWLAFLIGGSVASNAVRDMPSELNTLSDIETAASAERTYAVSALILVAAAILGVVMVRLLTDRQRQALAAGRSASTPSPWPPGPHDWNEPDPSDYRPRNGQDFDPWRTN